MSRGIRKQVNVLLLPEMAERLKALAEKEKRSISQMAGILIEQGIEHAESQQPKDNQQAS